MIDREWKDFGTNRSEALEYARELTDADYCLMIDADEILVYNQDFDPINWRKSLTADLYNVFAEYGGTRYHRPQLTHQIIRDFIIVVFFTNMLIVTMK